LKNVEDLADRGDFTFYALNIRLGKTQRWKYSLAIQTIKFEDLLPHNLKN
jgi:hypothetical protein